MHPSQKDKVMRRSFTRGKRPWQLVTTCLVVVFFVLYPTLIKQIARLNACERYEFGGAEAGVLCPDVLLASGTGTGSRSQSAPR